MGRSRLEVGRGATVFTGIVQGVARVERADRKQEVLTLRLSFPDGALEGATVGGSISVSGVCLTVTSFDDSLAMFDVIGETLRCTTLGQLSPGDTVNFERSATLGDEIGGHLLSGHIAGTVDVVARVENEGNLTLSLRPPDAHRKHILPKGYVALDGCSLTVGHVDASSGVFDVHLIPETRRVTTLDALRVGDRLNLEVDAWTQAVVATVEVCRHVGGGPRWLSRRGGPAARRGSTATLPSPESAPAGIAHRNQSAPLQHSGRWDNPAPPASRPPCRICG